MALGGDPVYREGVVTDNGNVILDVHNLNILNALELEKTLNDIPGVVCNGIFAINKADIAIVATDDGIEERRTHLTDAAACPRLDPAIDNDRGFEIAIRAGTGTCRLVIGKRDSRCDVPAADTVCSDLDISAAVASGIKGGRVFGKDRIDFLGSLLCHIRLLDVCGRDLHLSAFAFFELARGCFFQCRLVDFHRSGAWHRFLLCAVSVYRPNAGFVC